MSFRETIRGKTGLSAGVAIVVLVLAVLLIRYQLRDPNADAATADSPRAFFTVDDGKTWFVDSSKRVPPFEYNGKVAVRAHVFTSDGGKSSFVGYVERFTPDAKGKMEAAINAGGSLSAPPPGAIGGLELKKPGGREWIKAVDRTRAAEICNVHGSNGEPASAVEP